MFHLGVEFAYPWAPWLFLLLIPVALSTLIPYFLLNKKYRKTRNRIVSMVLHILVMTLCICTLTGLVFVYEVTNLENEVILLVDVSDTEEQARDIRDDFVREILEEGSYDGFRVGLVTFGFDYNYVAPLSYDVDGIYSAYLNADLPDTSATDIANALRKTSELFEHPESSKIVLITDGKETDGTASSVIGAIVAQGTKVDVVHIPSSFEEDTLQVLGVELPDYHIASGDEFDLGVNIFSKTATDEGVIELYDNNVQIETGELGTVPFITGPQSFSFPVKLETEGLHEIKVRVRGSGDGLENNNEYCTYLYLQDFNHVLIVEQADQSQALTEMLQEDGEYSVDILNVNTDEAIPQTVDELRQYDQIILNNIANSDLPLGFDQLLYSYVYEYGGGLFTVGGSDENGKAHAYNRQDLANTLLQQMLPVEAINYTPPVGVVIIIDISGSMSGAGEGDMSKLYWAKQGAIACLDALTERDYVGVMTLNTDYGTVLNMTPRTMETTIKAAIEGIDGTGGTEFSKSISRAAQMLSILDNVDRRHIVIVSDGAPAPSDEEAYLAATKEAYDLNGTTLSLVGISISGSDMNRMEKLVEVGHGRLHNVAVSNTSELLNKLRDDLNADEIKEIIDEPFWPQVENERSNALKDVEYADRDEGETHIRNALTTQLGGFYGARARTGVDVVLKGDYNVPLYAQWKYGKGTVGSFMSDLNGRWSSEFLADANTRRFLCNVVSGLMPTEDVRPSDFRVTLRTENYINQMSVMFTTPLEEGETVAAEIVDIATGESVSLNEAIDRTEAGDANVYAFSVGLSAENGYSRCNFIIKKSGTYRIVIRKLGADGTEKATFETYKSFAYSLEYDQNAEENDPAAMLAALAESGAGTFIEDEENVYLVYENFETALRRTFDPRWLFMILAIVLFLLDIAVRKFKFKWPHEIVRAYREKRAERSGRPAART